MFPMPQNNNTYQVGPEDRDLLTLAEKLKTDYPTLAGMNPSITSISTGQFINVPGQQSGQLNYNPNPLSTNLAPSPIGPRPVYGPRPPSLIPTVPPPTEGQLIGQQYANQYNNPASPSGSGHGTYRDARLGGITPVTALRLAGLQRNLETATDPSQFPATIAATDANLMGYQPAQMIQAGYVLQNGNWVLPGTPGAPGGGAPAAAPQTANNWMTNPSLHLVTFNKNAKNRKNTFVTTEKWARNAWKRKMRRERTEPAAEVRADTPSTTLDLVLGT